MQKLSMEALNRLSVAQVALQSRHPLVVVLDSVRSMSNVGSIFRSADGFGVSALYLCGITAQPPHREIHKTALGAELTVPWYHEAEIVPLLRRLKAEGYTLCALEQTDTPTWLHQFVPEANTKYALIAGNEVYGVADEALSECHLALEIAQAGAKHSLNVAVATGIAMYALTK